MSLRLPTGGHEIDRTRLIGFTFDGQPVSGYHGDTIASALLASGLRVVGRSFKYHRPRGIWGAGVEEPNAIMDVREEGRLTPNERATTRLAAAGIEVRSINGSPTALTDRNAVIDSFARFIPAAFYYKTFMWPDWHLFEPRIRAMAGLGTADPNWRPSGPADQVNCHCDVLVIGAGPAGLSAAHAAVEAGRSVMLVDDQRAPGGSLRYRDGDIGGIPGREWASRAVSQLREAGCTLLSDTTAFGIYDHLLVGLSQRNPGQPDRLWRVRPRQVVLATGAIERPLAFANNDLPGIMSADAALQYLRRFAILPGRKIVLVTNNDSTSETALALQQTGAEVVVVDLRPDEDPPGAGLRILPGRHVVAARGKLGVKAIVLDDGTVLRCDSLLVSGGWTPTIHLYAQAKGKLAWSDGCAAFVPETAVEGLSVAGSAAGVFDLDAALESGMKSLGLGSSGGTVSSDASLRILPAWPRPKMPGRVWIDYQNDVTAKDVELAARENFVSVEHLKRYTTLGMATDQGKTSNLNGLALMAEITGRTIPDVGTTTYRPPFVPVPLTTLAGARGGVLMSPLRRLPLETVHRAEGAILQEYGGWLRPAFYGAGEAAASIQDEARLARQSAGIFDASALGKIEVSGSQATEFVDFIYYNTMSTLKPGRCRYGFMLSESGIVYDDGILACLDNDRFLVSCSSSHVAGVHLRLEEWRQDRFDRRRLQIHNATPHFATLTVTGPRSRDILLAAGLDVALDDTALPHMMVGHGNFAGEELRVARVSFTGDRSYELSIRADRAKPFWAALRTAGKQFGAIPIGIEALMILRAEKGYIVIGKDTDGTTMPRDLSVDGPRARRTSEFVGQRSLFTDEAARPDRKQLVGVSVREGDPPLATGAHAVERGDGRARSLGFVTSSYFSPTLNRAIALALVEKGSERYGETLEFRHLGATRPGRLCAPCFLDPEGTHLSA